MTPKRRFEKERNYGKLFLVSSIRRVIDTAVHQIDTSISIGEIESHRYSLAKKKKIHPHLLVLIYI